MKKQETVAIFGGTFSPPHCGHIRAAEAFFRAVDPDKLLILPSALSPHKAPVLGADNEDRLAMCRLAFSHIPRTEVSDLEFRRSGKSYTVLTLEELTRESRRLVMLVGTDMFLTLDTWYRAADIFRLADIALMRREEDEAMTEKIEAQAAHCRERYGARILYVQETPVVISSTEVRAALRGEIGTEAILSPEVTAYIKERGLYRA